jgi:hypothetical protein
VVEFLAHASRHEPLRQAAREVRERGLEAIARIIEACAERHGVEYTLPAKDIARGSGALNRGMAMEQLLDPDIPGELFEVMHVAYMNGLTRPRADGAVGRKGRE